MHRWGGPDGCAFAATSPPRSAERICSNTNCGCCSTASARHAGARRKRAGHGGSDWPRRTPGLYEGSCSAAKGLAEAEPTERARVDVEWAAVMGVRHPATVSWTDPVRSLGEPTPPNTALAHAETAYRAAVRAAAEHAAHLAAAKLLAAEAVRTRQRVRALSRHWIPRLRRELAALELALEEAEQEEAVRRRWAASHGAR
ncbi:V-type ATP synthase subunit D [Streptomyces kaempferi]